MKAIYTKIENIDTDQIIPARFLKKTSKDGFGQSMFYDWRYNEQGQIKHDSIFARFEGKENHPQILVAGKNFGCGSSREHAAWALSDYGFKAIVSSFFADIFYNNALNNMLLPVKVSPQFLQEIFNALSKDANTDIDIDLKNKTITISSTKQSEVFPIGEYKQNCLLNNQKDIDFLLTTKPQIEIFEKNSK